MSNKKNTPQAVRQDGCGASLAALHREARGVYSGAYGWFGNNGACELAVTIRSLWFDDDGVRFGVGGAILLASDADEEWTETERRVYYNSLAHATGKDFGQDPVAWKKWFDDEGRTAMLESR